MTTTKPRERLTRDRIVDAAMKVMDTEGLDAVSMRRVAREVGVEAMSLYNHVRDKEDLLDGMLESIMGSFDYPESTADADWTVFGREIARGWRTMLKAHPGAIQLFAERKGPLGTVEAMRPVDVALGALMHAGLSPQDAVQAFHAIGGYIFGYVMMETGQLFGDESPRELPPGVAATLPNMAACAAYLRDCNFDTQFEFGLDLMLEGLRAKTGS